MVIDGFRPRKDIIMRYVIALTLTGFLLTAADATLSAQKDHPAHATGKPADAAKPPQAGSHAAPAPKEQKENGGGNTHTAPATHGKPTTTATDSTATKGKKTTGTATTGTSTATGTSTTTVTPTTPTTTTVKNAKLEQKLKLLLPAGTNMNDAAKGFKNWGQFVAAVHVAHNLNIPFTQLKAKMTGTTPMSLGQAVQALRSTTSTPTTTTTTPAKTTSTTTTTTTTKTTTTVQTEVNKAESEAAEDLRQAKDDRHR
jgi:hypothetical protein